MNMTLQEESQKFLKFINDNGEFFYYKDGVISLRQGIIYENLYQTYFDFDLYNDIADKIICGELIGNHDNIKCLDILGTKKIKDYVYKIINDEKKIESAYQIYTGIELKQNIQKILNYVSYRLALIGNLKNDKLRCYHRTILNYGHYDLDSKGKEIWLLSDNLMKKDKFYNLNSKYIDYIVSNKFQRAIFDAGTLVYDKLDDILSAIWSYREPNAQLEIEPVDPDETSLLIEEGMEQLESYDDEFEDNEEIDFDEYEEKDDLNQIELYLNDKNINLAFYLNYINHLNEFLENFGNNEILEKSKSKLLYLLDAYGDNLYIKENFINIMNKVSMVKIDYKEDFYDFYVISRLFLVDVLEGWIHDDMTLRKMIFVSTYYELTKDRRIKRIINKYRETEIGDIISKIVLEGDYSKLNSEMIQSQKK